jgi:hypothetical protein
MSGGRSVRPKTPSPRLSETFLFSLTPPWIEFGNLIQFGEGLHRAHFNHGIRGMIGTVFYLDEVRF